MVIRWRTVLRIRLVLRVLSALPIGQDLPRRALLASTFFSGVRIPMSGQGPAATPAIPGFLMWRATNAWQRAQRNALEAFGLTHVQFALLATLAADDAKKGLSQAEISARSGVDPMTTSQVVRGRRCLRRPICAKHGG